MAADALLESSGRGMEVKFQVAMEFDESLPPALRSGMSNEHALQDFAEKSI
jgi:hypothetical protein